jgi:hypothetical protein
MNCRGKPITSSAETLLNGYRVKVSRGGHYEVILQLPLISVIDQIHSRIDSAVRGILHLNGPLDMEQLWNSKEWSVRKAPQCSSLTSEVFRIWIPRASAR